MNKKILLLPGDGIGPEIVTQAEKVISVLNSRHSAGIETEKSAIGGAGYDQYGYPLPDETLSLARDCDAILLGAVGGPEYDELERDLRPEKGLLAIRSELDLFANLRPATLYPQLVHASSLKPEFISGLDMMIVRELTSGIYFGQPRGIDIMEDGSRKGYNTLVYNEKEITRIAHVAFDTAMQRNRRLCSVDKANVLEVSGLWREVMETVSQSYPEVELNHMYVDNAAMQLVKEPKQFDVIVTGNMFGDILSDAAAMLTGSIGMLASASLDANAMGMYEPIHGSAPDIAGQNKANPVATILSVAMMMRYTLNAEELAIHIENAVSSVLDDGLRTGDIMSTGMKLVSTDQMGDAIAAIL